MSHSDEMTLAAAVWESQRLLKHAPQREAHAVLKELHEVLCAPEIVRALEHLRTDRDFRKP
jgi:hypothetical protein